MNFLNKSIPLWGLILAVCAIAVGVVVVLYFATGSQPVTFGLNNIVQIVTGIVVIGIVAASIAKVDRRFDDVFKEYRRKRSDK